MRSLVMLTVVGIMLGFGGCLTGCTYSQSDQGTFAIEFTNGIKFTNASAKTEAKNVVKYDFPAIEEWIMSDKDEPDGN